MPGDVQLCLEVFIDLQGPQHSPTVCPALKSLKAPNDGGLILAGRGSQQWLLFTKIRLPQPKSTCVAGVHDAVASSRAHESYKDKHAHQSARMLFVGRERHATSTTGTSVGTLSIKSRVQEQVQPGRLCGFCGWNCHSLFSYDDLQVVRRLLGPHHTYIKEREHSCSHRKTGQTRQADK